MLGVEVELVQGHQVGVDSVQDLAVGDAVGAELHLGVVSLSEGIEPS